MVSFARFGLIHLVIHVADPTIHRTLWILGTDEPLQIPEQLRKPRQAHQGLYKMAIYIVWVYRDVGLRGII